MAGQQLYVPKSSFKKDNEYYTPKWVVDLFGDFDYDPATVKEKAIEFGIKNYDTIESDGLTKDWKKYKRIWCNPPFTIKQDFLRKAQETYDECGNEIYMLFPIEFMTCEDHIAGVRNMVVENWEAALSIFLMGELTLKVA